jgi:hypothetical protein
MPGTSVRPLSPASKGKTIRKTDPCSSLLSAEIDAPCTLTIHPQRDGEPEAGAIDPKFTDMR